MKMLLPDKVTGSVIGRGGSVLADFEQQTSLQIKVSPPKVFFPTTSERMVMASGDMTGIETLVPLILMKMKEHGADPGHMSLRLTVPNTSIPAVIGKGGETIRGIQSRTSVQLHLSERVEALPETVLEVKGGEYEIVKAVKEVMEIIQSDPRWRDIACQYYGPNFFIERERSERQYDSRPPRSEPYERSRPETYDRPPRSEGYDRPPRSEPYERSRPEEYDRPPRSEEYDRPPRSEEYDRPPRSEEYDRPRAVPRQAPEDYGRAGTVDPTTNPELLAYPMTIEFVVPEVSVPFIMGDSTIFPQTGATLSITQSGPDVNLSISGPLCGVQAAHLLVIKHITDTLVRS